MDEETEAIIVIVIVVVAIAAYSMSEQAAIKTANDQLATAQANEAIAQANENIVGQQIAYNSSWQGMTTNILGDVSKTLSFKL